MYCTKAESCFRSSCPTRPSSLDLFSNGLPSYSQTDAQQGIVPSTLSYGFPDSHHHQQQQAWERPRASHGLQEEDLIGRLDECVSDANSANYSTVDCTLSLGTPSTRFSSTKGGFVEPRDPFNGAGGSGSSSVYKWTNNSSTSNISWLPSKTMSFAHAKQDNTVERSYGNIFNQSAISNGRMVHKSSRNGSEQSTSAGRKCANCDTTTTPLWRNGPKGPKSLCNACGIRYKKEERRSTTCSSTSTDSHSHQIKKKGCDINPDHDCMYDTTGYNVLHRCCTDDNTTASCLTWQGSACVYLQHSNQLLNMSGNNISTASAEEEGPTLLFGRSVN